jgi:hypothetical protein
MVATAALAGLRGVQARRELNRVRADLPALRIALAHDDHEGAQRVIRRIAASAAAARQHTSGPSWAVLRLVPGVRRNLTVAAEIAAAADDLARGALPPYADAAMLVSPSKVRLRNRVDLDRLRAAVPPLTKARTAVDQVAGRVRELPTSLLLSPVGDARLTFTGMVDELLRTTDRALAGARLAPAMLGADGPRTYFLAFETNAEIRGTGGFVGSFGILRADRGVLTLERLGTVNELVSTGAKPIVDLDREFIARYRRFQADGLWQNTNMSPHYPYANAIWTALWERQSGTRVDGTVAVDPVALADLLAVAGPVTLPGGERIPAHRFVAFAEQEVYARYPDPEQRKRFQLVVARATYDRIMGSTGDSDRMLTALGRAAGDGHLLLASNHPDEQTLVAGTPIGGLQSSSRGPHLQVVANNAGGTKLDYYLSRQIDYTLGKYRRGVGREARVRIRLISTAPTQGLPRYVTLRLDPFAKQARPPVGTNRLYVSVYAGYGASFLEAKLDGELIELESETELGRPVFSTFVEVPPQSSATLELVLREPSKSTTLTVRPQPMLTPDKLTVRGATVDTIR